MTLNSCRVNFLCSSLLYFQLLLRNMADGGEDKSSEKPAGPSRAESSTQDDGAEDKSGLEKLTEFFTKTLGISSKEKSKQKLSSLTLKGVAKYIKSENCKNIIILSGAGISTSAGIPDFRSPGSGLYANLQKYNLPDPQCIFEISYFKTDPRPFYSLAKELFPGVFRPTPCHYFVRMLHEKGHLLRIYTQNIDTLERISGIPEEKIVEAHGTFFTSHCLGQQCKREFSLEWMKEKIFKDETPMCPDCGSYIKPDIVFFGENLPARFFASISEDFPKCDLLIVMGTSLVVQPFASLVGRVPKETPRLLINKEKAGQDDLFSRFLGLGGGMVFDSENNYRDVVWLGLCDDGCLALADLLGWGGDLRTLIKKEHQNIDEANAEEAKQEVSHKEADKTETKREWL